MLKTRVITAILALIPMLWIFIKGNADVFRVFFLILVGLSAYELASMVFPAVQKHFRTAAEPEQHPRWLNIFAILACLVVFAGLVFAPTALLPLLTSIFLLALLVGIFGAPTVELSFAYAAGLAVTLIYATLPWFSIWGLYQFSLDPRYIFLLCVVVWCGDTGAYFAGRSLGKHKLYPRLSPNKTWEGSVGGILASLIGGSCLKVYYGDEFIAWPVVILCCVLGGIFGQLGDLAESSFKRFAGVKDSGRIFPGHGGFLDRVDGLLFAAPAIWIILDQFGS